MSTSTTLRFIKVPAAGRSRARAFLTFQSLETLHSQSSEVHRGFAVEPVATVEETARDPVCGMSVECAGARHTVRHEGQTFYFCCARCRERFAAAPEDFLGDRPRLAPEPAPEGSLYTCPMDPEIEQATPGDCPICGMALEPMMPVAEEGPSPELRDLTPPPVAGRTACSRRVRAGDGKPRRHSLRLLAGAARLCRPPVLARDTGALDRTRVLLARPRLGSAIARPTCGR